MFGTRWLRTHSTLQAPCLSGGPAARLPQDLCKRRADCRGRKGTTCLVARLPYMYIVALDMLYRWRVYLKLAGRSYSVC